jgi:hypothetical protein
MSKNITSANSSASMKGALGEVKWEGYSTDSAFSSELVKFTETRMGVDGQMSGGYVPTIKVVTVDFEASSATVPKLMDLMMLAEATRTPQAVVVTITIPSVGKKFVCTGFITDGKFLFDAKKMLEPMQYKFDFESIVPMPI